MTDVLKGILDQMGTGYAALPAWQDAVAKAIQQGTVLHSSEVRLLPSVLPFRHLLEIGQGAGGCPPNGAGIKRLGRYTCGSGLQICQPLLRGVAALGGVRRETAGGGDQHSLKVEPGTNHMFLQVDIDEMHFLGRGAFGCVLRGTCRGESVAVKMPLQVVGPDRAAFLGELSALSSLKHPNVIGFKGEPTPARLRTPAVVDRLCVFGLPGVEAGWKQHECATGQGWGGHSDQPAGTSEPI